MESKLSSRLSAIQNEYILMFERASSIDTRAGVLLAFLVTALPVYFSTLDWKFLSAIIHAECNTFWNWTKILLLFSNSVIIILSTIWLIRVLTTRAFSIIKVNAYVGINLNDYKDVNIEQIDLEILERYINCINDNAKIVTIKAKIYKHSLFLILSFVITTLVSVLLNLI